MHIKLVDSIWALGLVLIALGLSIWQGLQLEWPLIRASGRALIQLLVFGVVLDFGFSIDHPGAPLGLLAGLGLMATIMVHNRIGIKLSRFWLGLILMVPTGAIVSATIFLILRPQPWYLAPYWLGLGGLGLGNSITVMSLTGENLWGQINNNRLGIETRLSLGATREQALSPCAQQAIRSGILPTINRMAIVGIATLPNFLGGLLFSGVPPLYAVVYQLLLLLLLMANAVITAILTVGLVKRHCFNGLGQFIVRE
jgi:putative ABC transport system permease protein